MVLQQVEFAGKPDEGFRWTIVGNVLETVQLHMAALEKEWRPQLRRQAWGRRSREGGADAELTMRVVVL